MLSLASSSAKALGLGGPNDTLRTAASVAASAAAISETSNSNSPAPQQQSQQQQQPPLTQTPGASSTSSSIIGQSSTVRSSAESPTGTSVWEAASEKQFALNGVSLSQQQQQSSSSVIGSGHAQMLNGMGPDGGDNMKSLSKNLSSMTLSSNGPSSGLHLGGDSIQHLDPSMFPKANVSRFFVVVFCCFF